MRSARASIRYAFPLMSSALVAGWAARASAQQPVRSGGPAPPPMQAGGLAPPPPMQTGAPGQPAPMQAGGLAPPPPGSGPPAPSYPGAPGYSPNAPAPNSTQRHLEASEREDSGRGLEFGYFQFEGGVQMSSLTALSEDGILLPGTDKTSGFRPYWGAAAGLRFVYFTVGPRFRFAHFTDWNIWTLNLDVGWHAPFGNFESYGSLGAGYAKVAMGNDAIARSGDVSIGGFDIRLSSGIDYYLSNVFSIGAMIGVDFVRLSRGPVEATPSSPPMPAE